MALLTLGALGVVFGDIGTSPLYALQAVFTAHHHAIAPTPQAVYGVISMVLWALILVVSVKYVSFVMRADSDGEGGILVLAALVSRLGSLRRLPGKAMLVALGVFGAALFFGNAIITPAISVLSAVEGLQVASPALSSLVLPIAGGVLVALFAVQRFGTRAVGSLFGPVCLVWFIVIALAGVGEIAQRPGILAAVSPTYALAFTAAHPALAFIALAGVVLAITGVEAMYADMGHFGRPAIAKGWFYIVFPALVMNYMGQGAVILHHHGAVENPFYFLLPAFSRIPMVALATFATVIASQAVISGTFSLARQAMALGYLPALHIRHTSESSVGQVYVPSVNWALFGAVLALVLTFRASASLATAYGVAVTGTIAITTILYLIVARRHFRAPRLALVLGGGFFLAVDLVFFAANLPKITSGGWLSVLVALAVFCVFRTWRHGQKFVASQRLAAEGPLVPFLNAACAPGLPLHRTPGTGIYLHADLDTTPLALRANVEHAGAMHRTVVVVCVQVTDQAHVSHTERALGDDLGYIHHGIYHLRLRYGFTDVVDVPAALALAAEQELLPPNVNLDGASYFISRVALRRSRHGHGLESWRSWRRRLFVELALHAASTSAQFGVPYERAVVISTHVVL